MKEEHQLGENSCPYSWLNEWLCEYVDGTMDPSLRRVFEKYVEANPDLKAHIERLRHTRELLCQCRQPVDDDVPESVPESVRARVREKVECDMLRTPHSLHDIVKERPMTAFVSSFVVALVVGLFAGAALFAPEAVSTRSTSMADTRSVQVEDRTVQPRSPVTQPMRTQLNMSMPAEASSESSYPSLLNHSMRAPYTVDSTLNGVTWRLPTQP
jgi:anti-sigma factor RsiW